MGGECKQKRTSTRLSDGNQLRNCWSQAVLTGRAIYQINRGGSDSQRMMGTNAASERVPYVRKWPGVGVQNDRPGEAKRNGGNVCNTQRRGWHNGDTWYRNQLSIANVSRVSVSLRCTVRYASRPLHSQGECRRARVQRRYIVARPSPCPCHRNFAIGTQFTRVLSRCDERHDNTRWRFEVWKVR